MNAEDFGEKDDTKRPPKKNVKKTKPKRADKIHTLGEVRLNELNDLKRHGKKPLKVDEQFYTPYYMPERCIVCGRYDIALHERGSGRKCACCIGISAKPLLLEHMCYGYNPNRYLCIPERLHEEVHRYPHRTLRFAHTNATTSPVHPSNLRPDLYPRGTVGMLQEGNQTYSNRTFTNYPPACIPTSLPEQTYLSSAYGTPAYASPVFVSQVAAKTLPQDQKNYLVPQYIRDKEEGKGMTPYGAFGSTYVPVPLNTTTQLPAPTFMDPYNTPSYVPTPAYDLPVAGQTLPMTYGAPSYQGPTYNTAYVSNNYANSPYGTFNKSTGKI